MSDYTITIEAAGSPAAQHDLEQLLETIDDTQLTSGALSIDHDAHTITCIANITAPNLSDASTAAISSFKTAAALANVDVELVRLVVEPEHDHQAHAAA